MPFERDDIYMIYFDNAATTGVKPQSVIRAVENALKNHSANPGRGGYDSSVKAAELVFGARQKIASFFRVSGPENVIFTLNCTHSINCVLKGVLQQGDHVLVSSLEHNAVMRPLKKTGVAFDVFQVSLFDDEQTVLNIKQKIKPNTRLVLCTGASNVAGKLLPIEKIGAICRGKGILFGVDAAQIAGVLPINMQKMNVDFLCVAPHKGLYAPMGTGILICEKKIRETVLEGGTGTNSLELVQPENLPERHESGTLNLPGIAGIGAGIDFVENIGIEKIYTHEMKLCKAVYNELSKNPQIEVYTPDPLKYKYAPVLSFNIKGLESSEGVEFLSKNGFALRGGFHCAPMAHKQLGTLKSGTLRFSPAFFNNMLQCEKLINLLKRKAM